MDDKRIAPAKAALMTAMLMGIASAMVGYLTLTQWYGPLTPMVSLLALALILGPLAVVLVAPELRELKSQGGLPALGISVIVAVVVAAAVGSIWRGEGVRASLVERGAGLSEGRAAEFAVLDSSDAVALRACQWLMERGELSQRRAATATLSRLPKRATACLGGELAVGSKQEAARTALVRLWMLALLGDKQDEEVGGALIGGLGQLAQSDDVAAAALFTCAVNHEDAAYRPLCADALASNKLTGARLVAMLGRVDEPKLATVWPSRLMAYAYHQFDLTPEDKKSALKLGLLTPESRSFAMTRSCESLATDTAAMDVQFRALATASCDVKLSSIQNTSNLWGNTCEAQQRAAEGKKKKSSAEIFCDELSQQLMVRATKTAQELLHAALKDQASALMANSIAQAYRASKGTFKAQLVREMGSIAFQRYYSTLPQEARFALDNEGKVTEEKPGADDPPPLTNDELAKRAASEAGSEFNARIQKQLNSVKPLSPTKAHREEMMRMAP